MSKGGNWVPIDKGAVKTLGNLNRPYSVVEALFSYTVDDDIGKPWTINGYAKMWQWSRGKVRRFLKSLRTHSGHIADRKGTQSGHPVHWIDQGLWEEANKKRTLSEHLADIKRDSTIDPNPNPDPNLTKKTYGHFKNVLLFDNEHQKLSDKFNSACSSKIEALSEYIENYPVKGGKYKSHYATILSWDRREKKGGKNGKGRKGVGFTEAGKAGDKDWGGGHLS